MKFLFAFFAFATFLVPSKANDGLTVKTQQGNVTGSLVLPTVRGFLGVPYASAARWQPPKSPPVRQTAFNATEFGTSCCQALISSSFLFLEMLGFPTDAGTQSEDCLSVNIWAPSVGRKQATAVLIWIYGGAFQMGTTNSSVYDGKYLVSSHDDIIVVTVNYRIHIFGQPNAPQLVSSTQSQNFGLLDIEAAILWVHDNIAAFGGDPNRITISGQSAGGVAVDAYAYSHPNDKIVKGIITQSGTLDLVTSVPISRIGVQEPNITAWNQVATAVGCVNSTSKQQFTCMLSKTPFELDMASSNVGATFYPILDDVTLFSNQPQRAADGHFLHVPMLGGSTSSEGEIFTAVSLWGKGGRGLFLDKDPISDLFTQIIFTCPARQAALDRVHAGVPTWRYEYQAEIPMLYSQTLPVHASEIPMVFGTLNATYEKGAAHFGDAIALSQALMSAWVAFARDPANGLAKAPFSWPKYNAGGNNIVTFNNFSSSNGVAFVSDIPNDSTCGNMGLMLERYNIAELALPFVF